MINIELYKAYHRFISETLDKLTDDSPYPHDFLYGSTISVADDDGKHSESYSIESPAFGGVGLSFEIRYDTIFVSFYFWDIPQCISVEHASKHVKLYNPSCHYLLPFEMALEDINKDGSSVDYIFECVRSSIYSELLK